MVLFIPHPDPIECAVVLDDRRIHSTLIDAARIICAVMGKSGKRVAYDDSEPHPAVVQWASKSDSNIRWVIDHFIALGSEYAHRTGQVHFALGTDAGEHVEYAQGAPSPFQFIDEARSQRRRLDFTGRRVVHTGYRMFLRALWRDSLREPTWTNRGPPYWLDDSVPDPHNFDVVDKNLLTMRARYLLGGVALGTSGEIDCPRCGSTLSWECPSNDNYAEFYCEDDDCIQLEEIKA